MDYKKKYEDLRKNIEHMYESVNPEWKRIIECYIPEIKECDDEEIKKKLIKALKECSFTHFNDEFTVQEALTWLEKQTIDISSFPEEQRKYMEKYVNLDKTTLIKLLAERDENVNEILKKPEFKVGDVISDGSSTATIESINEDGYIISNGETENDSNAVNWIIRFEDQDRWKLLEQDKVEPKFRIGDWVVFRDGINYRISNIYEGKYSLMYTIENADGVLYSHSVVGFDNAARIWSIKDAKDGDILCTYECDDPKIVFILKGTPKKNYPLSYYCFYNIMYPLFDDGSEKGCLGADDEDVKPATKEQHDLLSQKMKEAGYDWNAGLKGIEQIYSQWTGYDEKAYEIALLDIDKSPSITKNDTIDWLKSLKEKRTWKPSKEQIIALRWALNNVPYNEHKEELTALLDQIKNL